MKRFIRSLGILLALFLLTGLFTTAAAEETGSLEGTLNATPKALWDEGEFQEDGSLLYTVSMLEGKKVTEAFSILVFADGKAEVKNSAGDVVSTGEAVMREDGAILSLELELSDGIHLNQLRQQDENGQDVVLSQVIFADSTSAIIARSYDSTGEMLSSIYTEYTSDSQPIFEIEEVASVQEDGKRVFTTTVA